MQSIFTQKTKQPTNEDLKKALGKTFEMWETLVQYTIEVYPIATEEWKFTTEKFGWSFRISDKQRVIVYLLPRENFFKAAFVFGQKAYTEVLESNIDSGIIETLKEAKVYAEGRGIRVDVQDKSLIKDLKKLITIKVEN